MLAMASKKSFSYQEEIIQIALRLGGRIRAARVFRNWRQEDLAARTGLSRSTVQAIERGEETVAIGSVLQVLWLLGLANEVELIADPGLDREGLSLALDAAKKRVHVQRKIDDDF
jgi:transcriptional regulator with XRE-family HTH domain